MGGPRLNARLDALVRHVLASGADTVAVQELFVLRLGPLVFLSAWLRVAEALAPHGFSPALDPRKCSRWFAMNSGLAVFTRLPVERAVQEAFPQTREPLNRKGAALVALRAAPAPAPPVVLAVTHMDARHVPTRRGQADWLSTWLADTRRKLVLDDGAPLLVVGDMNVCPTRDPREYGLLGAAMARTGAAVDLFPGPAGYRGPREGGRLNSDLEFLALPTHPAAKAYFDHCFVDDATAARRLQRHVVLDWRVEPAGPGEAGDEGLGLDLGGLPARGKGAPVSDHRGLYVELEL